MKFASMLAVILAVSACGKDSHKNSDAAPVNNEPVFSLVGLLNAAYQSDCVPESNDSTRSQIEVVSFGETTFTRTFHYFDGTDCADGGKRATYVDSLINVKKEPAAALAGWSTYVYTYQAVGAQPDSVYLTSLWNRDTAFGIADWALGQLRDVSGKPYDAKAEPQNAAGDLGRRTLKIEGDVLTVARNNDRGIATAVDPKIYKKVP